MWSLIYKGERHVIVDLSETASNTALDTVATMMNGGSIEMLSADGNLLAVLKLSNPATGRASGGEVVFNEIAEGVALISGEVASARILSQDDQEVMLVDVGDESSDATIQLNTTNIAAAAQVRLTSFKLAMP